MEDAAIGYDHSHRYAYATEFTKDKRVLDLACGEGYGAHLVAQAARYVVGLDISEDVIKHATRRYAKDNLHFRQGAMTNFALDGEALFDVIIALEAIEHIKEHGALLKQVKRHLASDGLFIVSTPDKSAHSDTEDYINPYHLKELYFDEFKELLQGSFKQVNILGQRLFCTFHMWPISQHDHSGYVEYLIEKQQKEFVFANHEKKNALYFIAIASDRAQAIDLRISDLIDTSNELLWQKDRANRR